MNNSYLYLSPVRLEAALMAKVMAPTLDARLTSWCVLLDTSHVMFTSLQDVSTMHIPVMHMINKSLRIYNISMSRIVFDHLLTRLVAKFDQFIRPLIVESKFDHLFLILYCQVL